VTNILNNTMEWAEKFQRLLKLVYRYESIIFPKYGAYASLVIGGDGQAGIYTQDGDESLPYYLSIFTSDLDYLINRVQELIEEEEK